MDTDGHGSFDAFGVLGLPRELTLENADVENTWLELSREWHPDADAGDAEKAAQANRAKAILVRPSTRLRHWLELRGVDIPRDAAIDGDLMDLFAEVGTVLREADDFLKEKAAATTALGKALFAEREIALQRELQTKLADLQNRKTAVTGRFEDFEAAVDSGEFAAATAATAALGFLEKWESQIQERLIAIISNS